MLYDKNGFRISNNMKIVGTDSTAAPVLEMQLRSGPKFERSLLRQQGGNTSVAVAGS